MKAKIVTSQFIAFGPNFYYEDGEYFKITVKARYDDKCGNGHNTFAITGSIDRKAYNGRWVDHSGGCLHDKIAKHFPELAKYIKWHLVSSDGPMYYIENTLYFSKGISSFQDEWYFYLEGELIRIVNGKEKEKMIEKYGDNAVFKEYPNPIASKPNLDLARSTAIWPEASEDDLKSKEKLLARLPALMVEFRKDMREIGFSRESVGTEVC